MTHQETPALPEHLTGENPIRTRDVGAWPADEGFAFRVWAPEHQEVTIRWSPASGESRDLPLRKESDGTFNLTIPAARAGDRYQYLVDGKGPFPDPASRFQPEGVHGPSELVDPDAFPWTDQAWKGIEPADAVYYEIHIGTFSPESTFDGVTQRLPWLRDLGVTAIELMPLADFAGDRNWGYDGVSLFAPSRAYGRPDDLRRLVDTAHGLGLAVMLDVVYNHFGPSGNYMSCFSEFYLSKTLSSDWGACVNLAGEGCEHVRGFFVQNACHWLREYHLDGLRLDATHALIEPGRRPLVAKIVQAAREASGERRALIVAEDHRNVAEMLQPAEAGGWGLDGVWADDLHHQIRRRIAGDDEGYYLDYSGSTEDVARTINEGWFYQGQHSSYLEHARGTDPAGIPPRRFVVCVQNHDQIGNRALGNRLNHEIGLPRYRAASALLLCLPQTPLFFMGQEWASSSPFLYFTDHEPELGRLVTEGRRREFRHFRAFSDPDVRESIPDPQSPETFLRSRLIWNELEQPRHAGVHRLYQRLLKLRSQEPALRARHVSGHEAVALDDETLLLRRRSQDGQVIWVVARLGGGETRSYGLASFAEGLSGWEFVLDTEDPDFAEAGHPATVDLSGSAPVVHFAGPSAILLRGRENRP